MYWELDDTIVALSSPPGPGGRAVVRLSGPKSCDIAGKLFDSVQQVEFTRRLSATGRIRVSGLAPVAATLFHFPARRSLTGQTVVELHTLSSLPIVDQLLTDLLTAGARAARPGEFALRAFLAGKIDLPRAEALLGTIDADNRQELKRSLRQLAGGVSRPLEGLREDLLNLLADLEAGLDFADEDISFVDRPDVLDRVARALAQIKLAERQVEDRGLAGRPYRVVLCGPPNAGKTSLFNALTGGVGLVSATPGTTRDYLSARLPGVDVAVELVDTAGLREGVEAIESEAQRLGRDIVLTADLVLWCQPGGGTHPNYLVVATQVDRTRPPATGLATSVVSGQGLDELRALLVDRAQRRDERGLAPSLSRCRHHVVACLTHLRNAHQGVLFDDPSEIVALELRGALEHLGAMTGAIYTDDLLDRIFSRFCIGK